MTTIQTLSASWQAAKEAEKLAQAQRRDIEDKIAKLLDMAESFEGTINLEAGQFKIKITGRHNQKVDSAKLQEIAAEAGLTEHLSSLFRWKAELSQAAWKAADESITRPLLAAITTTPGRASFDISTKE